LCYVYDDYSFKVQNVQKSSKMFMPLSLSYHNNNDDDDDGDNNTGTERERELVTQCCPDDTSYM